MSNSVNFDAKFKLINLKSQIDLSSELVNIFTEEWKNKHPYVAENWARYASHLDNEFLQKVVSTVKETHFTHQTTCCISLQSLSSPPLESPPLSLTKHLTIIAQILYRSYGIEIQQIDDMKSPKTMVVTWHRDLSWLNPPSPYLVQSRKEGFLTDCSLKFGEKLFPVHRVVLAAKSPYFEKMFKSNYKEAAFGVTIPIIMETVEEKSVEMLLDYFYTGKLDLKEASITEIDNLVNFSSYFFMPHLAQSCFEYLCKSVNADNLKEYIALARHYNHKELESALACHIEKEVKPDNFVRLIALGKSENIQNLEVHCTAGILTWMKTIDYEPMGFGKSTQLKSFVKLFDVIIETRSFVMLAPLMAQMKTAISHPGYGTHLEKLIEYLAVTCEYQACFDVPNDLMTMKDKLLQDILKSIELRTKIRDPFSSSPLHWPQIEECLEVAKKYKLLELTKACEALLSNKPIN